MKTRPLEQGGHSHAIVFDVVRAEDASILSSHASCSFWCCSSGLRRKSRPSGCASRRQGRCSSRAIRRGSAGGAFFALELTDAGYVEGGAHPIIRFNLSSGLHLVDGLAVGDVDVGQLFGRRRVAACEKRDHVVTTREQR